MTSTVMRRRGQAVLAEIEICHSPRGVVELGSAELH